MDTLLTLSFKSSKALKWGYVLVFFAMVLLDQSTKIHAEKSHMIWSDTHNSTTYQSSSYHVGSLGVSPVVASLSDPMAPAMMTNSWVDFHLTYVRNHGAAWGTFSSLPNPWRNVLFYTVTSIAVLVILNMYRSSRPWQKVTRLGLLFILAGAGGNLLDRMVLGYVIDFLSFHWKIFGWEYNFPVFNVADVSINIGVGLLLIEMLFPSLSAPPPGRFDPEEAKPQLH